MIAHVKNGIVLRTYPDGKGRLTLSNGDTISPITSGYDNGTDRLLPVRIVEIDNSLTESKSKTSEYLVSDVEVVQRFTIVDVPPPVPDPKLTGIEFEGVMCSATSADQSGLMAVFMAIQMQGAAFPNTRFEFDNGNVLVIGLHNYQQFTAAWLPFRQSFFAV